MNIRSVLAASAFVLASTSHAQTATFDAQPEGTFGTTLTDGGIFFSNYDRRIPQDVASFSIDDARGDLAGLAGYTPNNVLSFGGWGPGDRAAFGRVGSFDFTAGKLATGASLTVFSFGNDPGITLTLQGIRGGGVVGSSSIDLAPGFTVTSQLLSLGGGTFDFFRVVSAGPTREGTAFMSVDGVSVQVAPEPTSMAALGLGAFGILKRRKKG